MRATSSGLACFEPVKRERTSAGLHFRIRKEMTMDASTISTDVQTHAIIERPEQATESSVAIDAAPATPSTRLISLDAFRGFMMLLMASEELGIPQVAKNFRDSAIWQFFAYQFSHVQWIGCGLWDLIQPSF